MSKKKVYVVPHSHWDREWYFTIDDSNVLLTQNLPYLMDVLEQNSEFPSYTFDGQLSVIEEYLHLFPEEKDRIRTLIADKRLFVGPWYTQTDSLLVNKESLIRNLLYGTRLGRDFGHSMDIGYLPDIFGQNQYLPSIFQNFGIPYAILQRGVSTDDLDGNLNFCWESPDGEKIKANHLYLGYGPGKFLSSDTEYVHEKLMPMLKKLEQWNKDSDCLLLPAGGDQVLVREHFPETIAQLNEQQDTYTFILSDYEKFMEETWKTPFENTIHGELIATEQSRIHHTIKSQRYDIKKQNYEVENKIIYILEPLAVISKTLGLSYPSRWMDRMWKLLFDVHAHDSIGGCNSDDTNADIMHRLKKVDTMVSDLICILKKQMTESISRSLQKENIIVIFNTKVHVWEESVEMVIFSQKPSFILKDLHGTMVDYSKTACTYISGGKQITMTADGEKEIELPGYYRSEVLIPSIEVPAMGYKVLEIEETTQKDTEKREQPTFIENEYYALYVQERQVVLTNKKNHTTIENVLYFEDTGDYGDSYDYAPLEQDVVRKIAYIKSYHCEWQPHIQKLCLIHEAKLPYNLEERKTKAETTTVEIKTTFVLKAHTDFVEVTHEIHNQIEDHRLRVILNTGLQSKTSFSDQGFSWIERENTNKNIENWKERKFAEAPVGIYALENFVALKDKKNIFGSVTKGIKEYEVLENSKIALTLFRSVGLLGRDDLPWRPGRASGINNKVVYTPDAQMKKKMKFEYALYFGENDVTKLFHVMDAYLHRYAVYQKQTWNLYEERLERFEIPYPERKIPEEYSYLQIDNPEVFQSVCKESYEKDGVIVRLFNPGCSDQIVRLHSAHPYKYILTNLYEEELCDINEECIIAPKSYITIKIKLNKNME